MKVERGVRYTMVFRNPTIHCDVTNPEARKYFWIRLKKIILIKVYYRSGWMKRSLI